MLRINLLPPERRKLRRTPLYALVPLILGVMLVTGATAATAFFWIMKIDLENQIEAKQQELDRLKHVETEFGQLTQEKARIDREIGDIMKIVKSKSIEWSEVLEGLVEVSSKNPSVWFDKIEIQDGARALATYNRFNPGSRSTGATHAIRLDCNAAPEKRVEDGKDVFAADPERIFKFREDLKSHQLLRERFREVLPINPDWTIKTESSSAEGFFLKFELVLVAVK